MKFIKNIFLGLIFPFALITNTIAFVFGLIIETFLNAGFQRGKNVRKNHLHLKRVNNSNKKLNKVIKQNKKDALKIKKRNAKINK